MPRLVSTSVRRYTIHWDLSSPVSEWRYPWDHRNTIISAHWHHSALQSSNATPIHVPHTPSPTLCSTVIVFIGQPIVCDGAWWTVSPISVQTMIQHYYCDQSFFLLNLTRCWSRVMRREVGVCSAWHGALKRTQIIDLWHEYSRCGDEALMKRHMHKLRNCHYLSACRSFTLWEPLLLSPVWPRTLLASTSTFISETNFNKWSKVPEILEVFLIAVFFLFFLFCSRQRSLSLQNETTKPNNCGIFHTDFSEVFRWDADGWTAIQDTHLAQVSKCLQEVKHSVFSVQSWDIEKLLVLLEICVL